MTTKWTMKDGTKIRIRDMTDSHLLNVIALLRSHHSRNLSMAYAFEGTCNGDMAQDAAESTIRSMEEVESEHPAFESLIEEAMRRNLEC